MKVEGYVFGFLAAFLGVVALIYWLLSHDPTGTTCLVLSGGLGALVGYYLLFTARRMEPRPEDRADAEIDEGSGEIGFFSPYSYWPIIAAGAAATVVLGLVFGTFLILIGSVFLVFASIGFLFEYYIGRDIDKARPTFGD